MINFELTDEQKILRESVREWAREKIAPKIPDMDVAQKYDRGIMDEMGELGFLGVSIPEKYGGSGMDYISTAIVSEELEYVDSSLRVVISVHNGLNSLGIYQWGNEEQKQKYLATQAQGKKLSTYGLTEPNAGSDVGGMLSNTKEDGDFYILNGNKIWISLADTADNFIIFAKSDISKGSRGISCFIVEREFNGVSTGSIKNKLGVRAGNTGFINFDDVPIPKENLLGELGEGFKIAMSCLDNGRFTVAAGSVGLAKAARAASVKYSKERKTWGKEIREHQLIQRLIAHMSRGIDTAELLVWKAGWLKNLGRRNTRETALAKWHATNIASQCADDAIQIHGSYGYSNEFPVERYWRNARGARIYEGTDQIQEIMAGQYATGLREDKPLRKELPGWTPED
ncbi:MAG: acyl-CoA dehydrogenase family protein [Candidatus Heimdallarchaeota archaeon]|nr:acyl-CoA dehydrogenase family protein [Candidatus Heimdallarchaeota archaeon]